jgi:hypothetical protein
MHQESCLLIPGQKSVRYNRSQRRAAQGTGRIVAASKKINMGPLLNLKHYLLLKNMEQSFIPGPNRKLTLTKKWPEIMQKQLALVGSAIYALITIPVISATILFFEIMGIAFGIVITSWRYLIHKQDSTPYPPRRNVLVVVLHGLGGSSRPLASRPGLVNFLRRSGFPNVVLFNYKSFVVSLQEAAALLDVFITEQNRSFDAEHVLLVGISAGGRVSLLSKHKAVVGIVPVVSPLRSSAPARLLLWLWPKVLFCPPILRDLKDPADCSESPPHASVCGDLFCGFDGKVRLCEMTNSFTASSTTIRWMAHSFSQIDPLCHQGENPVHITHISCRRCPSATRPDRHPPGVLQQLRLLSPEDTR